MGILKANTRRQNWNLKPKDSNHVVHCINSLFFSFFWLKENAETTRSLSTSFRMSSKRCVFLAAGYFHHRGSHPLTLIAHPHFGVSTSAVCREVNLWHISKLAAQRVNESPGRPRVGVAVVNIWPGIRKSLSRCERQIEHLVCWWVMPPWSRMWEKRARVDVL